MFGAGENVQNTEGSEVDAGSRSCMVIGESGADWSAGIATARRYGPNLALVTQWQGETPEHFSQRVISRLAKRGSFAAIVMVCNQRNDSGAAAARQAIVRASGEAMSQVGERELTLICAPNGGGGIPQWAPQLVEFLPRQEQPVGLMVALGGM